MTNNKLTDEQLEHLAGNLFDCGFGMSAHQVQAMVLELQEYRKEYRWIPITERLPGEGYHYLPLNLLLNGRTRVQGGWQDGLFWLDGVEVDNVTAWMPLPAAPEDDK